MDLKRRGELRRELASLFPGLTGPREFMTFLGDELGEEFGRNVVASEPSALQLAAILEAVAAAGSEPEMIEALARIYPGNCVIADIHALEKEAAGANWFAAEIKQRRGLLSAKFLVCAGMPFVDRHAFARSLDQLLAYASIMRVSFVGGTDLCGKSWTRHLVRSKCAVLGHKLIELDMKSIGAGDDVRLVCEQLIWRMADERVELREPDTKTGQYVQRLVSEVGFHYQVLRDRALCNRTLVLAIDSLNQQVGSAVLDFVEELVARVRRHELGDTRIVLFGFPRNQPRFAFAQPEIIAPLAEDDICAYLAEVAEAIGRPPLPEAERRRIAHEAMAPTALPPEAGHAERLHALELMSRTIHEQVEQMVQAS